MKYYIIAGEASGDLHGSNLVKAIQKIEPDAVFRGWGGDRMKSCGVELIRHNRETSFMGFAEVAMNIRKISRFMRECKKDILDFKPDTIILIDYPGFNLRMAKFAHEHGIRVVYYISPQVWAWKAGRVHTIKKYVDKMLVILPFEKSFYEGYDYPVDFVGHPLLDEINDLEPQPLPVTADKPLIALIPGSRKQEITRMLPMMLSAIPAFPEYRFIIGGVRDVQESLYRELMGDAQVEILFGSTYNLLLNSRAALVTSGTATLETALLNVPEVVCYRGSRISFMIAKQLVKIKFISLVNLVMDREVVKELIQDELNTQNLQKELGNLLTDNEYRAAMLDSFKELRGKLGGPGASARAAGIICGNAG